MTDFPRSRRLFVPLKTRPFCNFSNGTKTWELRKRSGQFSRDSVEIGRIVELRRGYSTDDSMWGFVEDAVVGNSLNAILQQIPFEKIVPTATSSKEARARISEHYNDTPKEGFICFKVSTDITYLEVTEEQQEIAKTRSETAVMKRGHHDDLHGPCVLVGPKPRDVAAITTDCQNVKAKDVGSSIATAAGFSTAARLLAYLGINPDTSDGTEPVTVIKLDVLPS